MLRILGSAKTLCDSITRRDMLRVGGFGLGALGLADLLRLETGAGESGDVAFGRAKRVILLYLYGAAAQHETFDPKPEAPLDIRGQHQPRSTAVPGVAIDEHLPKLAAIADRLTIIRSMTHPYNIHSAAYTLTGVDHVDIPMELDPYDSRHWPFYGSVVDYLQGRRSPEAPPSEIPNNIALPFRFSSRCPEFKRGGPYGGFLGRTCDPVWTEFDGQTTESVLRWRGGSDQRIEDPFLGITPESRLVVSKDALAGQLTLDRLDRRHHLLTQLDKQRRASESVAALNSRDRFRDMAYSLLTSPKIRDALDIGKEPMELRRRYGMNLFGQATLAGRRMLEAGARLVSVFWDEVTTANSGWDTHFNHYERLENELLPGLDGALSTLVLDLEDRGMLDDTLVLCLTEHGRTPKISSTERGAGREHWSQAYSNVMAGAGIARGHVVGRSDRNGATVADDPVSPKDILVTLYHLLGIDPHATIPDRFGRPLPLVSGGKLLRQALA